MKVGVKKNWAGGECVKRNQFSNNAICRRGIGGNAHNFYL